MTQKHNLTSVLRAALFIRLLPVIFIGISAMAADNNPLWDSLLSAEKPQLVKLTINGEFLVHLPKEALKNFHSIKDLLEEFPAEESIEVGPLLNITKDNAHEPLNVCITKVLPAMLKTKLTGNNTHFPDVPEANTLGVTHWGYPLSIRISMALGLGKKEDLDAELENVITQKDVQQLRKLQELIGLDTLEFGRVLAKRQGAAALLLFAKQLDENIDEFLEKVLEQKPFAHVKVQQFLHKISYEIVSSLDREAFKILIALRTFNFNQFYDIQGAKLIPGETGEILLSHCLAQGHFSQVVQILLAYMCKNKITPKDVNRSGQSTYGCTLKERICNVTESHLRGVAWFLLDECIISCLINNEQKD